MNNEDKLNWKILAYLRNATDESVKKIKEETDRETLIEEVLKMRSIKRSELVCKEIIKKNEDE
tara:strand:+ start:9857 stop:10045 length:189 start_codon:yes stop_codon:yes gene_type:complete